MVDVNRLAVAGVFWGWMAVVAGYALFRALPAAGASPAAAAGSLVGSGIMVVAVGLISHRVVYGSFLPGVVSRRLPEPDPYGTNSE